MQLLHPEALLLVPLLLLVMRRSLWPRPFLGVLRVLMLAAVALLLAQPFRMAAEDGRDIVLVVDRSRSMPSGQLQRVQEFASELAAELQPGDRIGVVAFAREARLVAPLAAELRWPEAIAVERDGSDLGTAMATALGMVPDGRRATLLVWSDGEVPRDAAEAAARLAARRSVRVDVEPVARSLGVDSAVDELRVPAESPLSSPFAVNAVVVSTASGEADYRLLVDGVEVQSGRVALRKGRNSIQLPARVDRPGEHLIAVEVRLPGDQVAQNDRGVGVVRGIAKSRVLCVTPGGREDRLTEGLRTAGLDLVVASPHAAPLTLGELDGVRAVVLENVPAAQLPPGAMENLKTWVRDLGGGLLMTGGTDSFGVGGYYRSPVEDVLPVTMEIREEQRRFGLALAIALDRSGSMQAPAGGTTKMQLANRGAAGAIELLSGIDAVSVLAVDTAAHVVVPLTVCDEVETLMARVRTIESSGGGIYLRAAVEQAVSQLEGARQEQKHIVLFADANDAEEPGDYTDYLTKLVTDGFTVSVIGLGTAGDRDAQLLEEFAQLGNGRCQFVADATELPRVFAQETIQVARSSLVEESTQVVPQPALPLLGALPTEYPPVGGYTVAWLRERADRGLATADEQDAPLLAHWQIGLGRAAAFLGEVDGPLTGAWGEWDRFDDFFATLVRWSCGGAPAGLFVEARREGDEAVYLLEVAADRATVLDGLRGVGTDPDGGRHELTFDPVGVGRVEVRVPLAGEGVHRAAVQIGDETVRLPPMSLPYSPEWALQPDPRRGERTLRYLAVRTGGHVAPTVATVLSGPRASFGRQDLSSLFAWLALALLVTEIAVRRLQVFLRFPRQRSRAAGTPQAPSDGPSDGPPDPPTDGKPPGQPADLLDALERAHRRGRRRV